MEEKFAAAVVKIMDTYIIKVIEAEHRSYLEDEAKRNGSEIVVWAEGNSMEEAGRKVRDLHLKVPNTHDEVVGLWYHYQMTEKLLDDIRSFRQLDLRKASDEQILAGLKPILMFHYTIVYDYKTGINLYRGRKYDLDKPLYTNKSDIWYPPTEYVDAVGSLKKLSMGRLNKEGESLLYTTTNFAALPAELRLDSGNSFYAVRYTIKEGQSLKVVGIGLTEEHYLDLHSTSHDRSAWTKDAKINHAIITEFLRNEFTRDVGKRTEFLYRATLLIAKSYFDMPDSHGYIYPSVAHKTGYNIAIKAADVDRCLDFAALRIFTYHETDDNGISVRIEPPYSTCIFDDKIQYQIDPSPMDPNKTII